MELGCLYKQLFMPDGPRFDPTQKNWLFDVTFYGNLRYQPKYFGKYLAYA